MNPRNTPLNWKWLRALCLLLGLLWSAATGRAARADAPDFALSAQSANKSATFLSDTVLYTVTLDNSRGSADALDVVFTDRLPRGIEVQLFALDGVPQPLSLLFDGLSVGTIPAGTSRTVTILGVVTGIPIAPDVAHYVNQASWTYRYRPAPGAAKINAGFTSNSVTLNEVRLEPSMAIATVALAPILRLGNEITCTLTIPNTGTLSSAGSTLTDLIPVGALYVAGSTTLNGAPVPDVLGVGGVGLVGPYTLGALINSPGEPSGQINIGEAATVRFKVTSLTLPVINATVVDADGLGPIPPLNVRGSSSGAATDLSIAQTDGQSSIAPGSDVTYAITVKNNGALTLESVRVSDALPPALQNPQWSASAGTYDAGSGEWTGLSLGAGQSVTLTLRARVSPLATGALVNSATVYPPSGVSDSNAANNSATDSDILAPLCDLGVTISDGAVSVAAGAPLSYLVTVSNAGPSALSDLTLTATLPDTLQNPLFAPEEGAYNAATGAWTGLDLRPGQSVQLKLSGTVALTTSGNLVSAVRVAPPDGTLDLVASNDAASDSDAVLPVASASPALQLTQSVDKTLAKNGEILTYTLAYRNASGQPIQSVGLRNALPAYTAFVGAGYGVLPAGLTACTITAPRPDNPALSWDFSGTLAPGAGGQVFFQVRVE